MLREHALVKKRDVESGLQRCVVVTTSPMPTTSLPLAATISREYLLHHRVCPRSVSDDGRLVVAVTPDVDTGAAVDDLLIAYREHAPADEVMVEAVTADELERLIERLTTGAARSAERLLDLDRPAGAADAEHADGGDGTADVRDLATQPPVVRYVSLLVRDAHAAGASDIHLEAARDGLIARFRLDGVLVPAPEPPSALAHAVVSRIKLLAELDIAERRRPQDGRVRARLERGELDLRVSTVPTMYGESVVLRLLDRGGRPVGLDELGMPASLLDGMARLAARPHGLVLVTGPTGSGKTTTLYAALQRRDAAAEKIITVEDPIEFQLAGVTQVPVHREVGVTFAAALRSILRQDPDVVMVGEMRDGETADVAVQAAMTGHLVFSTVHTNDAVGAVPRLLDLGVPPYLVAATLEGVLAQRLVRRVCDACRVAYAPAAEVLASLRASGADDDSSVAGSTIEFTRGAGCPACRGTGFRGRVGLFELMPVTDAVKDAIGRHVSRAELRATAAAAGLRPLGLDGWRKVRAGLTTAEEVLRVVQH